MVQEGILVVMMVGGCRDREITENNSHSRLVETQTNGNRSGQENVDEFPEALDQIKGVKKLSSLSP